MSIAIYPGSFDPITYGHIDIVKRMSPLYEKLYIVISNSITKKYMFTSEERLAIVEDVFNDVDNLEIIVHDGLTVDVAKKLGAKIIIRGLRAVSDFEYEMAMAAMNKNLDSSIETVLVFSSPEFHAISSRMVKEVAFYGGDISNMIPLKANQMLFSKLKKRS